MGEKCIRSLAGKAEGKRLLGAPRPRWENIKVDLKKIICEAVGRIPPTSGQPTGDPHVQKF
jgi:hypothetical protein